MSNIQIKTKTFLKKLNCRRLFWETPFYSDTRYFYSLQLTLNAVTGDLLWLKWTFCVKWTVVSYVCCVSGGYIANATLIVQPVNTVALAGTRVQLQCTTDLGGSPGRIIWFRIQDTAAHFIVNHHCEPDSSFPQYSVNSTSGGQCDLVINKVSLVLASTYRCTDIISSPANAILTVIGEFYV